MAKYRKEAKCSPSHNVERNCRFFHVVQHASGDNCFFLNDYIADCRFRIFTSKCEYYGVTILHSVIMPDHTHDIVYCNCYDDIAAALHDTNLAISRIIRKKHSIPSGMPVFSSRPSYTAIKSIRQYYNETMYLFMNPKREGLELYGFEAKHSTFTLLRNGYVPYGFDETIYERLLGMSIWDYLELLEKPAREYMSKVNEIIRKFPAGYENTVFKIDPVAPFTTD